MVSVTPYHDAVSVAERSNDVTIDDARMASASDAPRGRRTRPGLKEFAWCGVSGGLSLVLTAWVLKLWRANLHAPFGSASGDGATPLALMKDIIDHGWFATNPDLGAPFGQVNYDFSTTFGDFWNLVILRIGAFFTSDPALLGNAFFVLSFVLAAVSAHAVLRTLRFSVPVAIVCAQVFAFMPYHFWRGQGHLFLSLYWSVPLGALLVLGVLGHVALYERRPGARLWGWATWPTFRTVLILVVIGGAGTYYAIFTLLLLVAATAMALLLGRGWRVAVTGTALAAAVLVSIVAYMSPSLLYTASNGANELVGQRVPQESLIYGLTGIQMLLPPVTDKFADLREPLAQYAAGSPISGEGSSAYLGLLLAFTFVLAAGRVVLGRRRTAGPDLSFDGAALAVVAFLLGTVGSVSAIIAYTLTPGVRGWNRISIMLAFFVLVVLAVVLERGRRALIVRRLPARPIVLAAATLLVAFAVWEQDPIGDPDFAGSLATWQNAGRQTRAVEAQVPDGTMVLQLPYQPFPEAPPQLGMNDYDHLQAYLQSDKLKFSYGAMKGRPEDFMAQGSALPTRELVPSAAAAGFGVVWVDRAAYADRGAGLERDIVASGVKPAPIVSSDGRFAAYLMGGLANELSAPVRAAAAQSLLRPATVAFTSGFAAGTVGGQAAMALDVPTRGTRDLIVQLDLIGAPGRVTFRLPNGREVVRRATPEGNTVSFELTAGDGDQIQMAATQGGVQVPALRIDSAAVKAIDE